MSNPQAIDHRVGRLWWLFVSHVGHARPRESRSASPGQEHAPVAVPVCEQEMQLLVGEAGDLDVEAEPVADRLLEVGIRRLGPH